MKDVLNKIEGFFYPIVSLYDNTIRNIKTFKRFIKNIWIYRNTLKNSFYFDFQSGYYEYIRTHLEQYIKAAETGRFVWPSVNQEKYTLKAKIAHEYVDRIIKGKGPYDYYDIEVNSIPAKDSGLKQLTFKRINLRKILPNINSKGGLKIIMSSEQFYHDSLHELLRKYSTKWWD